MKLLRLTITLALGALLALHATAQYPSKPIRIIVPFAAGGGTDVSSRLVAQALSQSLGQPVLVENMPSSDGQVGALEVARAAADGYTLFVGSATAMSYVPAVRKTPPYDPMRDFTPVASFYTASFFLYAHPGVPATTLGELIAYAHANPGKLRFGIGTGTAILASADLLASSKTDMVQLPFKGEAPAAAELLAGRIDLMFATPAVGLSQVREGKLRVLATMLPQRSPMLPEVPTIVEAGLPALAITPWGGFFGPAGMPKDVTDRLSREISTILARPDVRDKMEALGYPPLMLTRVELEQLMKQQLDVWRRAVAESRLTQN